MKDLYLSRRKFLVGASRALIIPFLPSIHLPALAAGEVKRLVSFKTNHGYVNDVWSVGGTRTALGDGVTSFTNLTSLSGAINAALDTPDMNNLKAKINVLRGLDNITVAPSHNNARPMGIVDAPTNTFDQLLANSNALYPGGIVPGQRSINVTTTDAGSGDFGLNRSGMSYNNGALVNNTQQPYDLFQVLFAGLPDNTNPGAPVVEDPRVKIVDQVKGDFDRLMNHPQLSTDDRDKLDQHITVLNDLENKFRNLAMVPNTCEKPAEPASGIASEPQKLDLFFDLIYFALKCDLTRVVNFPLSDDKSIGGIAKYHAGDNGAHAGSVSGITSHHNAYATKIGEFIQRLDNTTEGEGTTMLDNSLIYWCHEHGELRWENPNGGTAHTTMDQAIFTAGSLGGKIDTGKYFEYHRTTVQNRKYGLPINYLLESIMRSFGMSPSEYEDSPGAGYASYAITTGKNKRDVENGYLNYTTTPNVNLPGFIKT